MEEKNKSRKSIIFIIGFLVGFFMLGLFIGKLGVGGGEVFMVLISFYVWLFISINIHEFGHFVFGKKAKYKLMGYSIGCFNWIYENGRMKFRLKFNKNIGGLCAMVPTKGCSKRDHLLFISGGVIFNFISIVVMLIGLMTAGQASLKEILIIGMITTGGLALMNFIPIKSLGVSTDGNIFWSILRNEPSGKLYLKVLSVTNELRGGIGFKDLDLSLDIENSEKINEIELQIVLFKYFKALHLDNIEEIRANLELLEKNINVIPEYSRPGFYYELIYYYSAMELNEEKSKKYFDKAKKILLNDKDINGRRTLASYELFIENNVEVAKKCCLDGLSVKDKFPLKGQALLEEKLIKEILNKIN